MAIEFLCPACQGTLSMPDDAVGRLVRCGNCMTTLRVPDAAPTAPRELPLPSPPPPRRPRKAAPVDSGDRDEHGEPRPRRGKKKAGRGPIFWIVIILLALGFFTCLACGGGTLILATPRWHTHQSDKGNFKVDFPAQVNPNIEHDAKIELKPGEHVEGAVLAGRLEFYWVWYKDFPERVAFNTDEQILDETVKNLSKEGVGTVEKEVDRKVDNYAAREVVIVQPDGQTHHCLIVVAKSRLYIATAGGPFVSVEGNERVRRFLDSFHILNPNVEPDGNPWRGK